MYFFGTAAWPKPRRKVDFQWAWFMKMCAPLVRIGLKERQCARRQDKLERLNEREARRMGAFRHRQRCVRSGMNEPRVKPTELSLHLRVQSSICEFRIAIPERLDQLELLRDSAQAQA